MIFRSALGLTWLGRLEDTATSLWRVLALLKDQLSCGSSLARPGLPLAGGEGGQHPLALPPPVAGQTTGAALPSPALREAGEKGDQQGQQEDPATPRDSHPAPPGLQWSDVN